MVITQLTTTVHASVAARSRKQRHQKEWITTNQTLLRYKRRLPYLVDFLEGRASTSIIDINNMNIKSNSQTPRRYSIECQYSLSCYSWRFRILESSVPMVQAAKDRMGNNVSDPFDQARAGGVLDIIPFRTCGTAVPHLLVALVSVLAASRSR